MADPSPEMDAAEVAERLAAALDEQGQEYALGGAIALGYWGEPRGTLDVDLTVFLPIEQPSQCIWLLQQIGCDVRAAEAIQSFQEHGLCHATFQRRRVDVFVPTLPFYESARQRRRRVQLGTHAVMIWDAESLCVFKMMFFRRKDIADVEQILRIQGANLDRAWVRQQLQQIFCAYDPRLSQWDELDRELRT